MAAVFAKMDGRASYLLFLLVDEGSLAVVVDLGL
jgi:hypothetical protein